MSNNQTSYQKTQGKNPLHALTALSGQDDHKSPDGHTIMILTKEHLIIFGSVGIIGAAVVALLISDFVESTDTFGTDVSVAADIADDLIVLQYTIFNTGQTEIESVSVSAICCGFSKGYDDLIAPGNRIADTVYLKAADYSPARGDVILVEFLISDIESNSDAFVRKIILR